MEFGDHSWQSSTLLADFVFVIYGGIKRTSPRLDWLIIRRCTIRNENIYNNTSPGYYIFHFSAIYVSSILYLPFLHIFFVYTVPFNLKNTGIKSFDISNRCSWRRAPFFFYLSIFVFPIRHLVSHLSSSITQLASKFCSLTNLLRTCVCAIIQVNQEFLTLSRTCYLISNSKYFDPYCSNSLQTGEWKIVRFQLKSRKKTWTDWLGYRVRTIKSTQSYFIYALKLISDARLYGFYETARGSEISNGIVAFSFGFCEAVTARRQRLSHVRPNLFQFTGCRLPLPTQCTAWASPLHSRNPLVPPSTFLSLLFFFSRFPSRCFLFSIHSSSIEHLRCTMSRNHERSVAKKKNGKTRVIERSNDSHQ